MEDYDIQRIKTAKLAYLAFIANFTMHSGRKLSTFEREYFASIKNLEGLAAISQELPDEVKNKIEEFRNWALQQDFIIQKPVEVTDGYSTVMMALTLKGYEHLQKYAYQSSEQQPQQPKMQHYAPTPPKKITPPDKSSVRAAIRQAQKDLGKPMR